MNKFKTIFGVFLGATMLLGVGAAVSSFNKTTDIKEAQAAINSVSLAGNFNGWDTTANPMTKSGNDYVISNVTMNEGQGFKVVINNSTWCDAYCLDTSDWFTNTFFYNMGGNDKNSGVRLTGTYNFKFTPSSDTWGSLVISGSVAKKVFVAGGFNDWSTTTTEMSQSNGVWTLNDLDLDSGDEFKVYSDGNWFGAGALNSDDSFTTNNFGGTNNIKTNFNGTYNIEFKPSSYSMDSGTITMSGDVETIPVTLKVTFANPLQDWLSLYIPGSFNSWAENDNSLMTASADRKSFTYVTNVAPGENSYKLVPCFTSKGFSWNTKIDSEDQTFTIAASDEDTIKTIRSNLSLPDMPQEYVPADAKFTLTFGASIAPTIGIYYCGSLTGWANNPERLASALMTPNANHTVYTFNLPENTPTDTVEYKIVAMSLYGGATAASYDYTVYDNNGGNASAELTTSTHTIALNANSTNLDGLGTSSFAEGFTGAMATPCSDEDADNETAVSAIWGTWQTNFEGLTSNSKSEFGTSQNAKITQARKLYVHCVGRYDLATWNGAPSASARVQLSVFSSESNNALTIITIIASIGVLTTGAYMFFKKGKKVEQ